jgi:hypothetical protein
MHIAFSIETSMVVSHMYMSVLHDPSFNPTTGCMDSKQCTGKGGLLAFMEVSKTVCASAASGMWAEGLREGEIVGIIIGSIVGVALLGCVLWMGLCRKKHQ